MALARVMLMLKITNGSSLSPRAKESTMKSPSCISLLLLLAGAVPAQAALPRLAGSGLDYVLMPFLGYLLLVLASWVFHLPGQLRRQRD